MPKGLNNLTPKLGFTYKNNSPVGVLGKGWGITGMSVISRTPSTYYHNGYPKEINFAGDQLALDGKKLILIDQNLKEYRCEKDNIDRIIRETKKVKGKDLDYFIVYTRGGLRMIYGETPQSQLLSGREDKLALMYFLNRIEDQNGNFINYEYDQTIEEEGSVNLLKIKYGSRNEEPNYIINFEYKNTHEYAKTNFYSYGSDDDASPYIYTDRGARLQAVKITKLNKVNNEYKEIRRYDINYEKGGLLNEEFLNKITLIAENKKYKSTIFDWEYTKPGLDETQTAFYEQLGVTETPDKNPTSFTGDFNGDGLSDITVYHDYLIPNQNNKISTKLDLIISNGDSFENVLQYDFEEEKSHPIAIGDFNGDGRSCLLINNHNAFETVDFALNTNTGQYSFNVHSNLFINNATKGFSGDFNGDGLTDFITYYKGILHLYTGDPENILVDSKLEWIIGEDRKVYVGDFDGDSKKELLYGNEENNTFYCLGLNLLNDAFKQYTVSFTDKENKNINDSFYHDFFDDKMSKLVLGDFNNDGKTDLITTHGDNDTVNFYFSYGHNFEYQIEKVIPHDFLKANDVNGNRRTDLIAFNFSGDFNNTLNAVYYYLDLTGLNFIKGPKIEIYNRPEQDNVQLLNLTFGNFAGTGKKEIAATTSITSNYDPYYGTENIVDVCRWGDLSFNKIVTITNGLGKKIQISYEPLKTSSHFSYDKQNVSYPLCNYIPTAFIVTKVLNDNGENSGNYFLPKYYYYKGGILHKRGKGFLGFKTFTVKDYKSQVMTKITFDLLISEKKYYEPYKKLIEKYAIKYGHMNTALISRDSIIIGYYNNTTSNKLVYNTYIKKSIVDLFDVHSGEKYKTTIKTSGDYDIYGNPGRKTIETIGYEPGVFTHETIYNFTYWNYIGSSAPNKWAIGKLTEINLTSKYIGNNSIPEINHTTLYNYYTATNDSRYGKLESEVSEPDNENSVFIAYDYDKIGNLIQTKTDSYKNPSSKTERIYNYEYGDTYDNRFITKVINPLGHEITFEYNFDWEWVTKITSPDGLKTISAYDKFGNPESIKYPDNTYDTNEYLWVSDDDEDKPVNSVYKIVNKKFDNNNQIIKISTVYFDKLGRKLRDVASNFSGKIYKNYYFDNNTGLLASHSKPFFKGETEYKTIFGYDQLQRLISKEMPGNRVYTTSYNNLTVSTLNPENQQEIKMYDSDNNLIKSIDNDNNTTNYTYDVDGRLIKTELNNNDKTSVSYSYDIFGNLIQVDDPAIGTKKFQFDCFDQITRVEHNDVIVQSDFVYDKLGRILQKNENDEGIAVWHYDKQFKGMIDNTQFTNTINGDVYLDNFVYNDYAKLSQQDHSVFHDGVHRDYAYTYTYNNAGLLNELGYPSGLKLKYNYSEGQVTTITRESDNKILWRLYKENALNQIQSEAYGNSISTSKTYYPETNLIKQIFTSQPMKFGANRDVGHKIQDFTYDWDNIGNLISRVKKLETGEILTEQFDYDNLNRLTHDFINNGANGNQWSGTVNLEYDNLGRIIKKTSDDPVLNVGNYAYSTEANNPYKLVAIDNLPVLYANNSQTITYTKFDKVSTITQVAENGNTKLLSLYYGINHERQVQVINDDAGFNQTKIYIGKLTEEVIENETSKMTSYLLAPDGLFAINTKYADKSKNETLYYVHKDHLGSIQALTDENGKLIEEYSYDPWGLRRDPNTWKPFNHETTTMVDRGFTGHEHLDAFSLINMNGRIYDPVISYFTSPDPFMRPHLTSQDFNPYTYVHNRPLSLIDPTGYWDESNDIGGNPEGLLEQTDGKPTTLPEVTIVGEDKHTMHARNVNIQISKLGDIKIPIPVSNKGTNGSSGIGWSGGEGVPDYRPGYSEISSENGINNFFQGLDYGYTSYDNYVEVHTADNSEPEVGEDGGGGQISIDESHNRIGFVPLDAGPNHGAFQMANYRADIRIRGNQNNIFVGVINSNTQVSGGQVVFTASALLVVDGNAIQKQVLNNGSARFELPNVSNVSLTIEGGWTVYFDSGGSSVPVYHPILWPFNLNFKDEFKIK